jgi:hypothetical protein
VGSESLSNLSMSTGLNVASHEMPQSWLEKVEKPSRLPLVLLSLSGVAGACGGGRGGRC